MAGLGRSKVNRRVKEREQERGREIKCDKKGEYKQVRERESCTPVTDKG
jgi:hypothetical protein